MNQVKTILENLKVVTKIDENLPEDYSILDQYDFGYDDEPVGILEAEGEGDVAPFIVLGPTDLNSLDYLERETRHVKEDRQARKKWAQSLGPYVRFGSWEVDRKHPMGIEVHTITTTGVDIIMNKDWRVIISYLIATPGQLRRLGITDPGLLDVARINQQNRRRYKKTK